MARMSIPTGALGTALALAQDAFGNGITGNEERSLRYIADAVRVLRAGLALAEAKGDVRTEMAAEKDLADVLQTVGDKPDWPKFVASAEGVAKYLKEPWAEGVLPELGEV